jgi:hypothetical protein
MNSVISLTPGFSPVLAGKESKNRFNGFPRASKPLKRLTNVTHFHHPAAAGC